jgi:hypothetical protein
MHKKGIIMNSKKLMALFALVLFAGCSPNLIIKKDLPSNEIALCMNIVDKIPDTIKHDLDSITNQFMQDYNNSNKKYKLISCQNDSTRSLFLKVLSIQVTNPGLQAAGVIITIIGTATPFVMLAMESPIIVWFGYLPRSSIGMNMELSKDISGSTSKIVHNTYAGSGKFFGSYEDQKKLLLKGYYDRLNQEMILLEKNIK